MTLLIHVCGKGNLPSFRMIMRQDPQGSVTIQIAEDLVGAG